MEPPPRAPQAPRNKALEAYLDGWIRLSRTAVYTLQFVKQLAPYLSTTQLEQANYLVQRRRDFYVVGPPLSLTNAVHWFRVYARQAGEASIAHGYVTVDSNRVPSLGVDVLGDVHAAQQWALNHWVDELQLAPKTPACVQGYLLQPPNANGQQPVQLAYVGLTDCDMVTVLSSDDEPLCELLDDSLRLSACWAPLVGE